MPGIRQVSAPTVQIRPNESQALILALLAVLAWSTVATGFKLGLALLATEQLLLLGTAISWLIFACYALATRSFSLAPRDRWLALVLGTINPCAYYLILFSAYERLPAFIAQPLNYTWAVMLALLAVPILKQRLSRRMLSGVVVSYAGVVILLATANLADSTQWSAIGVALALLSTVLWAVYWLLNTRSTSSPGAMMFWSFSAGLPMIAVACWLGPGWPDLTPEALTYGAWVGAIEMGITYLLWQHALKRTAQAARIGQLIFLSPFLSLILISWILQEPVGWGAIVGLLVIVVGLRLANGQRAP